MIERTRIETVLNRIRPSSKLTTPTSSSSTCGQTAWSAFA
jgi:hypothetical protein